MFMISMKSINKVLTLGLVSLTLLSTGCGKDTSSLPIMGTWGISRNLGNGMTVVQTVKFESGSLTLTNTCTVGGTSGTASVTTGATFTDKSFTTLEEKSASTSVSGAPCRASIEKGTLDYTVANNKLTLRDPSTTSDETLELVRK
jgi:hypothetical protein